MIPEIFIIIDTKWASFCNNLNEEKEIISLLIIYEKISFSPFILSFLHLLTCVYIVCTTSSPTPILHLHPHFQAEPVKGGYVVSNGLGEFLNCIFMESEIVVLCNNLQSMLTNNVVLPTEDPIWFDKSWDQFGRNEETQRGKGCCPETSIPNWCYTGIFYYTN
jgi:hypothetical protein